MSLPALVGGQSQPSAERARDYPHEELVQEAQESRDFTPKCYPSPACVVMHKAHGRRFVGKRHER